MRRCEQYGLKRQDVLHPLKWQVKDYYEVSGMICLVLNRQIIPTNQRGVHETTIRLDKCEMYGLSKYVAEQEILKIKQEMKHEIDLD